MQTCKGTKLDGSPCTVPARTQSEFCHWHDPDSIEKRKAASSMGGRKRRSNPTGSKWTAEDIDDLESLDLFFRQQLVKLDRGLVSAPTVAAINAAVKTLKELRKDRPKADPSEAKGLTNDELCRQALQEIPTNLIREELTKRGE